MLQYFYCCYFTKKIINKLKKHTCFLYKIYRRVEGKNYKHLMYTFLPYNFETLKKKKNLRNNIKMSSNNCSNRKHVFTES